MARLIDNWIEGFVDYTDNLPSSPLLRKWSAIAAISGALERKTWVHTMNSNLYPNLYVLLVAPPGIGKTVLARVVQRLWKTVPDIYTAPTSVTKASFVDVFAECERTVPSLPDYHGLQLMVEEFGVFLPAYDNEFMNLLTTLYDCGRYEERRRGNDLHITMEKTQLTMYACTTPSYLNTFMPEGAWDQGFISRCILVFSGEQQRISLFAKNASDKQLYANLKKDLRRINKMVGEFVFEPDAAKAIDDWYMAGNPPVPDHPKLAHYLTRRTTHVLKLMMICSAAESDDLVITLDHFNQALGLLLEVEELMPDIFKVMNSGGDAQVMRDCWHTVFQLYTANGRQPIPKAKVVAFLQERVPAYTIDRIIDVMVQSELFREVQVNKVGTCYVPELMEIE